MTPYLLTGLSVLIAAVIHWRLPNSFWKASLTSTASILIMSLLTIFVFQSNYLGFENATSSNSGSTGAVVLVGGLVAFFGLLVSLLVGYLLKAIRPKDLRP